MKKQIITIICVVVALLVPLTGIQSVSAGTSSFSDTSNNTALTVSFSYPDTFTKGSSYSIPVTIGVNFQNPSITKVEIDRVLIIVAQGTISPNNYPANQYIYTFVDYSSSPSYITTSNPYLDVNAPDLWNQEPITTSVTAKIYMEIKYKLINGPHSALGPEGSNLGLMTLYTGAGQQPQVTISQAAPSPTPTTTVTPTPTPTPTYSPTPIPTATPTPSPSPSPTPTTTIDATLLQTSTPSPTAAPTVPEYPFVILVVALLVASTLIISAVSKRRKGQGN